MKTLVTLGIVALLALPAVAEDSPLVAAAKKSRERRKKPAATVITNDTLAKSASSKAHVTTTAVQREIKMPEPLPPIEPTSEQRAAKIIELKNSEAAEAAAKAKKEAEAKAARIHAAEAEADEAYLSDQEVDPAEAERRVREAHEGKTPEQKPPHG